MEALKKSWVCSEKTIYLYVTSCMILMPLAEVISEFAGVVYYSQPAILTLYGIVGCIICILKIICNISDKGFSWREGFFISLTFFSAISLIFSSAPEGMEEGLHYCELPTHFLAYYCLLYASFQITDKKRRKNVISIFAILAFLEGIIGIFQSFGIKIQEVYFGSTTIQVYGLTQNTNFFGGLSVLFFGVSIALFIFSEKKFNKLLFGVLFAISFYCSFNTMARLAWVGDFAVLIFMLISILIMKIKNKNDSTYKEYLFMWLISVIIVVLVSLVSIAKDDAPLDRIQKSVSEIDDGNLDNFGSYRGLIWRYCLESVPKHWVTGIGLDNLRMCFYENPSWQEGMYSQGKAHNEYIHTLATQGVFALINYLILLILSAKKSICRILKTQDDSERLLTWIVLAMFTGYVVQAFFNSSIINVAMYFWIVIGLLNPVEVEQADVME